MSKIKFDALEEHFFFHQFILPRPVG